MSYDWKQRDPEGYARWGSGYGFLERTENMSEERSICVSVLLADGKTVEVTAGVAAPFEVIDGHLHVLNPHGYLAAAFGPGIWAYVTLQPRTEQSVNQPPLDAH